MNSCNTDNFLATTIICSLSALNCTRNYLEQIQLVIRAELELTRQLCYRFRDSFYAFYKHFQASLQSMKTFLRDFFDHIRKSDCKLVCLKILWKLHLLKIGGFKLPSTGFPANNIASLKWQLTILNDKNCKNNLSETKGLSPR